MADGIIVPIFLLLWQSLFFNTIIIYLDFIICEVNASVNMMGHAFITMTSVPSRQDVE